jgi:cytochrome c-type biogenesis protein CcmH/NrfG
MVREIEKIMLRSISPLYQPKNVKALKRDSELKIASYRRLRAELDSKKSRERGIEEEREGMKGEGERGRLFLLERDEGSDKKKSPPSLSVD